VGAPEGARSGRDPVGTGGGCLADRLDGDVGGRCGRGAGLRSVRLHGALVFAAITGLAMLLMLRGRTR
jgi:hypothetical protein